MEFEQESLSNFSGKPQEIRKKLFLPDFQSVGTQRAGQYIRPKLISNPNLAKSHLPIRYFSVAKLSWNFVQIMAMIPSCSLQNI